MVFLESAIKLNTIEFEKWIDPYGNIETYCKDRTIVWDDFDKIKNHFFSYENKILSFWEKYKDKNILQIKQADWSILEIRIPSIINWWMGTNVSGKNLVKAMNEIWFWWHLSSIWIWFYYFEEKYSDFYDKKNKEQKQIIERDFDNIFKTKLWLNNDFINKHFFVCDDLWGNKKNIWFNWELGQERLVRMMDLIAIYETISDIKNFNWNVWINCMYKTSSYIASMKISILAWVDYITTAAWNPTQNPKDFLSDFYKDLKEKTIDFKVPALWLLVSISRAVNDLEYDYYIFEDWYNAWWHIIRWKEKYTEIEAIKNKLNSQNKNTPVYVAWWIYSNEEIRQAFEKWCDWVQIGTSLAVSQEAIDWKAEKFKNTLIARNHLWKKTELDYKYEKGAIKQKEKFEKLINICNKRVYRYLRENIEDIENDEKIEIVKDYIYKLLYRDFFKNDIKELNDDEKIFLEKIEEFLEKQNEKIDIYKILRNYWNALKFIKEFDKFLEENNSIASHIVFDSTVWFPWRTKFFDDVYKVISGKIKSIKCVNCLTDCILVNRWNVRDDRWSTFCIKDWLDQTNNYTKADKLNIAFSWRSTVPYSEIRPVADIMAYFMWTYIER